MSEESICFDCLWHGNCTDETDALIDNNVVGECPDYEEGEGEYEKPKFDSGEDEGDETQGSLCRV